MDVASYDEAGALALDTAVQMSGALPADGWLQRIAEGQPFGPIEALLAAVRGTVYARATAQDAGYGLETEMAEPDPALVEAAAPASKGRSAASPGASSCSRPGSRSAPGSVGPPIPIMSTGWRSSGSRAANMISASTATGSIRPGRSPRLC